MLKRRELTDRKFWTNCEESVLRTVMAPWSFTRDTKNMDNPGKAKIAAAPTARLGRTTRIRVLIWTLVRSLAVAPIAL
jgi:hypothetical protein